MAMDFQPPHPVQVQGSGLARALVRLINSGLPQADTIVQ